MAKLLILVLGLGWVTASPLFELPTPLSVEKCGYDSCTEADQGSMLNVHIVPHTHDDVGWLKTVDQYYYGSRNDIQKAGVQYILDSVIKELWANPKRRFIYVETAFFWKWWVRQSDDTRHKVHTLVRQGRLQMVGGAWSMNDEAASHYHSTIDQFTWGLSKLNQTFGSCGLPRVAWQIDPFGHSRELASLLAAMGYDGLFLGRIDYQDKDNRMKMKSMEMLWRGDDDLGKSSDIFTGVLYNTYSPPPGFCFDILCQDEPIVDDPDSPLYNVEKRISDFLRYVSQQKQFYRSNNVIMTMGGDFTYQEAGMYFKNLDKLIVYTNMKAAKEGLNVKLFYSTPDCYLKAVKDAKPTLPVKQDDFFPYASDPTAFWTGYFTSRPTTKYFERQGNIYLQMAKQLQVMAGLEDHNSFILNELKSAMGIMQHHDAITGTEKQHVTSDYVRILDNAVEDSLTVPRQAFNKYMQGDSLKTPLLYYNRCRLNESSCETSERSEQFVVTVYNTLAWNLNESIRIPVVEGQYAVYAPNGDLIPSQLVDIPQYVLDIPSRDSQATHEVVFIARLQPTSYKNFFVKKTNKRAKRSAEVEEDSDVTDTEVILNDDINDKNDNLNGKSDVEGTKDGNNKKRDFYNSEMNEYWKNVREQQYVDIKNIEDQNVFKNPLVFQDIKIPDEPVYSEMVDRKDFDNVYLNVLKDKKNAEVPHLDEFESYIRESKKLLFNIESQIKEHLHHGPSFPNLSQDEMRMLADDPQVVERFPEGIEVENQHFKLQMADTIDMITLTNLKDGSELRLNLKYSYYPGCLGNNENWANRSSGAYIFRPNSTEAIGTSARFAKGATGAIVKEIRLTTDNNVASSIRLYDGLDYIENDWVVGPIDITDDIGKEFVVKYSTDLVTNGEFYTDSNGRQMLKRKLSQRPQWNVTLAEPVPGNYYPVTNKMFIEDGNTRVAILIDRSEGGTSLVEGEIELMLHRRLLHDDAFGVGEALNETERGQGLVARGTHRIYIANSKNKPDYILEKKRTIETDLKPLIFISKADEIPLESFLKLQNSFSFTNSLPDGLHLLTLEPWRGNTLLLRLENYLELSDRAETTIEIDLTTIFKTIKLKSFRETTLAANRWFDEVEKWSWNTESVFKKNFNKAYGTNDGSIANDFEDDTSDDGFKVKIKAKQIRTFVVEYEMN